MNDAINNSVLNAYLKELKKACPRTVRNRLVSDLSESLYNYLEHNPNATYTDLEQRFGTPENYASEYLRSMDDEKLTGLMNKSGWIKKSVMVLTVTAVIIIIISGVWLIHEVIDQPEIYYYETGVEYGTTGTLD